MNATANLYSNSIKNSCPSRLPNSAFVTGKTLTNALAQLYTRVCAWALHRGSSHGLSPVFPSTRGPEDSTCAGSARGAGFPRF